MHSPFSLLMWPASTIRWSVSGSAGHATNVLPSSTYVMLAILIAILVFLFLSKVVDAESAANQEMTSPSWGRSGNGVSPRSETPRVPTAARTDRCFESKCCQYR